MLALFGKLLYLFELLGLRSLHVLDLTLDLSSSAVNRSSLFAHYFFLGLWWFLGAIDASSHI